MTSRPINSSSTSTDQSVRIDISRDQLPRVLIFRTADDQKDVVNRLHLVTGRVRERRPENAMLGRPKYGACIVQVIGDTDAQT
jgi:hypothetical protein